MPDRPYTDTDLREEAARQHAIRAEDPDYIGVSEMMEGSELWDSLADTDRDAAHEKIHDLVRRAADLSSWAVEMSADGLEPSEAVITLDGDNQPFARIHLAFAKGMSDEDRAAFALELGKVVLANL